jgi:hypothetical protein
VLFWAVFGKHVQSRAGTTGENKVICIGVNKGRVEVSHFGKETMEHNMDPTVLYTFHSRAQGAAP